MGNLNNQPGGLFFKIGFRGGGGVALFRDGGGIRWGGDCKYSCPQVNVPFYFIKLPFCFLELPFCFQEMAF